METTTYIVYLPKLDIAFDKDAQDELLHTLDKLLGMEKCGLTINRTPFNRTCKFTVAIYALGKTEEDNRNIMDKIENWLSENSIAYKEYSSRISWDDDNRVFLELEVKMEEWD